VSNKLKTLSNEEDQEDLHVSLPREAFKTTLPYLGQGCSLLSLDIG